MILNSAPGPRRCFYRAFVALNRGADVTVRADDEVQRGLVALVAVVACDPVQRVIEFAQQLADARYVDMASKRRGHVEGHQSTM